MAISQRKAPNRLGRLGQGCDRLGCPNGTRLGHIGTTLGRIGTMAGVAAPSSGDRVIGNQQQHLSPQEDAEVAKGGWDDWDEVRIDWDIPMGQGWDTLGRHWDELGRWRGWRGEIADIAGIAGNRKRHINGWHRGDRRAGGENHSSSVAGSGFLAKKYPGNLPGRSQMARQEDWRPPGSDGLRSRQERSYVWMIFGVMKKISSWVEVFTKVCLNRLPRIGMLPRTGTWFTATLLLLCTTPPITTVPPSVTRT
jgi:hypothetical protein